MTINKITCRFILPYIVQPEGSFTFKYNNEVFDIDIKYEDVPVLHQIITGIKYNPSKPVGINGPSEIFRGISRAEIGLPASADFSPLSFDDTELRNRIANILNEYQYCYLHISGKSWGNPVSVDHFVNMDFLFPGIQGLSSNWGGSHRQIPQFLRDQKTLPEFKKFLDKGESLTAQYEFLVDARKHYMSGEYHLMYVEIAVAFESLVTKAFRKISNIYERDMFKEGKLKGQLSHLLSQYLEWDDKQIEAIKTICQRRNEVVHNNRRKFRYEEAYEHLVVGGDAIREITDWINA
ncbi:hypothetical protein ACFLTS_05060 [Chloroflexota bacterium]